MQLALQICRSLQKMKPVGSPCLNTYELTMLVPITLQRIKLTLQSVSYYINRKVEQRHGFVKFVLHIEEIHFFVGRKT